MTAKQWLAKGQAYAEAAEHLEQSWTDDDLEFSEGEKVSAELQERATKCFRKGRFLERKEFIR